MKPSSTYSDDYHRHVWADAASEIILERFSETRDGDIKAELTIRTDMPPKPGLLKHTKINLLSDRAIKILANELESRIDLVDWWALLTHAFHLSVTRYRQGTPPELLHEVEDPGGTRWLLEPFVERDGATVLFAPGDTGKSYIALCAGIAIASGQPFLGHEPTLTGPVLYLDWEASKYAHHRRLNSLTKSKLPIYYRRESASLYSSADEIRRQILDLGVVTTFIDSIGLARGGAPESAEDTIRFFAATRKLGIPCFCVDHISKDAMSKRNQDNKMPFGSVYTQNSARLVWAGVRKQGGNGEIDVHLENTKSNNGPKAPPVDITLTFDGPGIEVSYNLNAPRFHGATDKTQKEQLAAALEGSAGLSVRELEALTGIPQDQCRPILSRSDWFERVMDDKNRTRWILT